MQIREQRAERANLYHLVARARYRDPVGHAEEAAICALWRSARHRSAGSVIELNEGIRLITKGWAAWLRRGDDGRRLIFLFLMPGDFIVPSLFQRPGCDLICLTPLRTVDASPLLDTDHDTAPCSAAIIGESVSYYRLLLLDHLTRLTMGCTTKSVAQLLVELHARSERSGACIDGRFSFPIGQRALASAIGRSTVQVNKVIKRCQADGLLSVGSDWIEMHDVERLRTIGGVTHSVFNPPRPVAEFAADAKAYVLA